MGPNPDDGARWPEQWARVERYFERVFRVAVGRPAPIDIEQDIDDTYAFFLNCFYLGDWLKADGTVPKALANKVDAYIRNSRNLALCADIANAAKHLRPGRDLKSGQAPGKMFANISRNSAGTFDFETERLFDQASIYVQHGQAWLAVMHVAAGAMQEWRIFFEANGLSWRDGV